MILHYHVKGDFWDFPRGKLEKGETEQQTAVREIREETGLSEVALVTGFRKVTSWYYRWEGANIYKEAVYFLAEVKSEKVTISHEHVEFMWVDFRDAMQTLTYGNTKEIMRTAHSFLQKRAKGSIEKFSREK